SVGHRRAAPRREPLEDRTGGMIERGVRRFAGGGEGANEMGTFFALASSNSAKVVRAFVTALPE
ncbi:hypothetical protein J8J40_26485, partial [Mycobacterium tuberculosis]|nr:hypothetical protein [Mycobacterium tuberculosis]